MQEGVEHLPDLQGGPQQADLGAGVAHKVSDHRPVILCVIIGYVPNMRREKKRVLDVNLFVTPL